MCSVEPAAFVRLRSAVDLSRLFGSSVVTKNSQKSVDFEQKYASRNKHIVFALPRGQKPQATVRIN